MVKIIGGIITVKALKKVGIGSAIGLSAIGGYEIVRTLTSREAVALSGGTSNPIILILIIIGILFVVNMITSGGD